MLNKIFSVVIILSFVVFIVWQGTTLIKDLISKRKAKKNKEKENKANDSNIDADN